MATSEEEGEKKAKYQHGGMAYVTTAAAAKIAKQHRISSVAKINGNGWQTTV